ncbi:hypothetical protein LTR86_003489 [Recurvomyces mirabilis]|nr:hypothetical protein LTR86_003489 [Recurvomyces mirabilis]
MAGKIKAKDLSYDSSLPPFLQRLHDQKAGRGDQDLHERQLARPKREKNADEDDGPTVVDESGDVVSKDELEKLNAAAAAAGSSPGEDVGGSVSGDLVKEGDGDRGEEVRAYGALPGDGGKKDDAKVSTGLGGRKRKAGKVVGNDQEKNGNGDVPASKKEATSKPKKKKVKPVKLAFDDGDEG